MSSDQGAETAPNAGGARPLFRDAFRRAFGPALLAGALGIVAELAGRLILGIPSVAELSGGALVRYIPLPLFSQLLSFFGTNAKHWYFGMLLVGQGALLALVGAAYWGLRATRTAQLAAKKAHARDAIAITTLSVGLSACALALALAGTTAVPGGSSSWTLPAGLLSLVLPSVVFGASFVALLRRETPLRTEARKRDGSLVTRRQLLRGSGLALAGLAGGIIVWRAVSSGIVSLAGLTQSRPALRLGSVPDRIVPPPVPNYGTWTAVQGQTTEVTSTGDFYYVSKNLAGDPTVTADAWQLQVSGEVYHPYSLTYSELLALPRIDRYHTLECISNEVGGNLMSNAQWTGTSLADVLTRAGVRDGASELIFHGADGYSDSLHLSQALDPRALIVYHINGEPLPQPHGFPARLLIPGLYGMKNGKWLTSLEVGSGNYTGYWEEQGWTREAVVKTTARIDVPHDGDLVLARPTYIAGVAYAGERGISRVDVSVDGGQTWAPATLKRPLGMLTWVLWEFRWAPQSGNHVLVARAVDGEGYVQSPIEASPLPDGSSGYDAIGVTVR